MILRKLMSNLAFFVTLAAIPLVVQVNAEQMETNKSNSKNKRHYSCQSSNTYNTQAYGKLSASPIIGPLVIFNPQGTVPSTTGWQPFPVDIFSTSSRTFSCDPCNATITVCNCGTYLINALLTLAYPTPGSEGPLDLTNYCIGIICNDQLQTDSIGSFHISTEASQENPGLLFSCSLSNLITLPENSTIQFVVSADTGADCAFMEVISVNATVVQISD